MEIKRLLESGYIIIPDTNVLLNLYRYSPEFSEFGLQCLQEVIDSIYLPATVRIEFGKHCRAAFSDMEKRINNAGKNTEQQVAAARNKILSSCEPLERLHFPEVNVFRSELESLLNRLAQTANEFFEERRGLELSSHYWGGSDKVAELVKGIESYNHVFSAPSQEDIFTWCEEGQERYKKEIPPGFKDAKSKDGVRKYGDLIIWKELLNFARTQSKDIVFITDDVKADWWESENEKRICFPSPSAASKLLCLQSEAGEFFLSFLIVYRILKVVSSSRMEWGLLSIFLILMRLREFMNFSRKRMRLSKPCTSAITSPFSAFFTQPVSSSLSAICASSMRKPTFCTRPWKVIWRRTKRFSSKSGNRTRFT